MTGWIWASQNWGAACEREITKTRSRDEEILTLKVRVVTDDVGFCVYGGCKLIWEEERWKKLANLHSGSWRHATRKGEGSA